MQFILFHFISFHFICLISLSYHFTSLLLVLSFFIVLKKPEADNHSAKKYEELLWGKNQAQVDYCNRVCSLCIFAESGAYCQYMPRNYEGKKRYGGEKRRKRGRGSTREEKERRRKKKDRLG